jgi:hypothetical protein
MTAPGRIFFKGPATVPEAIISIMFASLKILAAFFTAPLMTEASNVKPSWLVFILYPQPSQHIAIFDCYTTLGLVGNETNA